MPVRVRYKITVSVSSTSAEEKDLGNAAFEIISDDLGEGGSRKTTVAASTTDFPLDIGNIADAKMIIIRTNAKDPTEDTYAIDLKKNGTGGEITTIQPLGTSKEGHLLMSTTGVTALYATNSSSVDMEVTVFAAGD